MKVLADLKANKTLRLAVDVAALVSTIEDGQKSCKSAFGIKMDPSEA